MSGVGTPLEGDVAMQPKQISNRLLNMKFMQRAAASSIGNESSHPSTPSGEPRAKRRRTGDFSTTVNALNPPTTPSTPAGTAAYGIHDKIGSGQSIGMKDEATRRGINNFDAPGVETEWVLDIKTPVANGTTNGTGQDYDGNEDDDDESDEHEYIWSLTAPRGRQTYGSFKKKKQKAGDQNLEPRTTPGSKKRVRGDNSGDEDLSSMSSRSESGSASEGEIEETPRPKKKGMFDFRSEADLRRMDNMDFRKAGFESGLGRQRQGLSGGGTFGLSGYGQRKNRKKNRKTM